MGVTGWRVRRHIVEQPDALQRWDRAYQLLIQLSTQHECPLRGQPDIALPLAHQEAHDETGSVCAGIHTAAGTNTDN
jgi:hypothetical protein